jgi:hypothetical protein
MKDFFTSSELNNHLFLSEILKDTFNCLDYFYMNSNKECVLDSFYQYEDGWFILDTIKN